MINFEEPLRVLKLSAHLFSTTNPDSIGSGSLLYRFVPKKYKYEYVAPLLGNRSVSVVKYCRSVSVPVSI